MEAFKIGPDENSGKRFHRPAGLGTQLDHQDLAAAGTFGQLMDLDEVRVGAGQIAEGRGHFRGRMVAVERHLGGKGRDGQRGGHQGKEKAEAFHRHLVIGSFKIGFPRKERGKITSSNPETQHQFPLFPRRPGRRAGK